MFRIQYTDIYGNQIQHLTQWDVNQTLSINDWAYEELPMFHFCNIKSDTAICVMGERSPALEQLGTNNIITVRIPNKLLQEPYNIIAYVYLTRESNSSVDSRSIYKIEIPVEKRVKPSDYIYSDEWANEIYNCGVSYDSTAKLLKVNGGNTITQIKLSSTPQEQDDVVNKRYVDKTVEAISFAGDNRIHTDITVPISAFTEDNTYTSYPYKAEIALEGVTMDCFVNVVFSLDDALSGNFAPVATSETDKIVIYAKTVPETDIIIPTIYIGNGVTGEDSGMAEEMPV